MSDAYRWNVPLMLQAKQWNGSNWHSMLEFAGKDVVATGPSGTLLVKTVHDRAETVQPTDWVAKDIQNGWHVFSDEVFQVVYVKSG